MRWIRGLFFWILGLIKWFWNVLWTPAGTLGLGFLTLGGFIGGVMFWGAFNTALEATNRESFCIGCHEMRANVYEELSHTIHFSNRSGVRAGCPDCHVPHEWTHKIARKMQASKEVWGKIFGTVNTRQKFLEHRIVMAKREWARLKANDSLECRNCHSAVAMDLSKQAPRAASIHSQYLLTGQRTCIECHQGIAHQLPDMTGIEPGWTAPKEMQDEPAPPPDGRVELQGYLDRTPLDG
ncbi:NapC/NirT family cytochrome c [Paracoccus sp. CPCC 101403]|uniref:Cytochrome c-type protein n=1 Tax=Paracoccus broussonetiae TaxID=3075834 RepID=A0ABU3EKA9_9RHOB|nr:NapC/NirT family cytochrome c [Paracoccus sp. CPCC 101403]MDT1064674.1 NapC/NirT family cytochrome c [Paracoccus sp. CPCC 101403]